MFISSSVSSYRKILLIDMWKNLYKFRLFKEDKLHTTVLLFLDKVYSNVNF